MRSSGKTAFTFIVLTVAAAVLSGCQGSGNTFHHKAKLRVKGKVLFVPLRDEHTFYFDSAEGAAIARAASLALDINAPSAKAVDFEPVRGLRPQGRGL